MASSIVPKMAKSMRITNSSLVPSLSFCSRTLSTSAATAAEQSESDSQSAAFAFSDDNAKEDHIFLKAPISNSRADSSSFSSSSVTMPTSFMTGSIVERQAEKMDPLLEWVHSQFEYRWIHTKKDVTSAAHSSIIQIEEDIELVRLEEDLQVDKWGLVEGGHDTDIADLRVQISSATVFLALSRRF